MKIIKHCPTCNKVAEVKGEMKVGNLTIKTYLCGHTVTELGVSAVADDTLDITSLDGKKPFPFQLEGGRFAEASNIRCLIADEMGLGKTVQAMILEVAHPEVRPFIAFVKSKLVGQWQKEAVRWGDFVIQAVDSTRTQLLPGFDGYIISLDSAWRMPHLEDNMDKCKVKSIIVDECQLIKNDGAKRTKAIQSACKKVDHIIALSGTPIKNSASEYFPILNILRPDKFPNKNQFLYGWCDSYNNGYGTKTGGLKNPQKFQEFTKDFIIRRERKQVLPDLPDIFRQFTFSELGSVVEDAYAALQKEFEDAYDEGGGSLSDGGNLLGFMAKMRHLTGLAKVIPVCEFVEDFITTTDRKIAIFCHHNDVADSVKYKLAQLAAAWTTEWGEVLQLKAGEDPTETLDKWRSTLPGAPRVCILSTLAHGEGLNLQFCADCIIMERQWNPANEEQAEARFPRPGQLADKINAIYPTAIGTIDEFLAELVERKRAIFASTMKGEKIQWDQSSLMKELADVLREKGGKKWQL